MALAGLSKKQKKTGSEESAGPAPKAGSANRTVHRYMLVPALVLIAAVSLSAGWILDQTVGPVNDRHRSILTGQVAEHYEAYFNNELEQHRSLLSRLADSEDVINRLRGDNRAELADAERRIASQVPSGLAVRLFTVGTAETRADATPPLGFAGLDMIRRAEQGQQVPWEAHQADGQAYLHSVIAVRDNNGTLVGTLSVSQSLAALQQALNGIDGRQGNVVVRQQFPGGPLQTLLTYGAKTNNEVITLRSDNPNWTLTFQPSDELAHSSVFDPTRLWAAFGLVLALGLGALFFAGHRIQAALRHDGNALTRDIGRMVAGQPLEPQNYTLAIFNSMAQSLNRLRMGRSAPRVGQPVQPPGPAAALPTAKVHQLPTADNADGDFDVTMMEGDSDLLGMEDSSTTSNRHRSPVSNDIFRAYDIRGVVGETLDAGVARRIGLAIGSEAYDRGEQTVIVGRDGRLSSPELAQALIGGLTDSGRDVIDLGSVPTPLTYFASHSLGPKSCVMVTGSHNPPQCNGFKTVLAGNALSGDDIQGLYRRLSEERFLSGHGTLKGHDVAAGYINRIVEDVKVSRPLKVVVDCGNGVAGAVAPKLIKSLGCHVLPLYCDVDGHFPNHHPDPGNPENLRDLARTVVETRADIGLAFDGDGDRIGLVTNSGKIIQPDRLLMLLAKDVITRNPGASVIYDVTCSRRLHGLIVGYGGKPIMCKTGHSHIRRRMQETGALLAGERSGHVFYQERWYGFDDALYTAARLLEVVSARTDTLDALFGGFPEDLGTEHEIPVGEVRKFGVIEQLQRSAHFDGGKITDIDGLRVDFPDGWGLVRASNTMAKLVCRFEADTDQALKRIQDAFRQQLLAVDSQLSIPF